MFDELFEVEKLLSHWPVVHSYFNGLLICFARAQYDSLF